jgi:hypothetical protein
LHGPGPRPIEDAAFLALSHRRPGHDTEARRLLDEFEPSLRGGSAPPEFWDRMDLEALHREVEAEIRLDPPFPAMLFGGHRDSDVVPGPARRIRGE